MRFLSGKAMTAVMAALIVTFAALLFLLVVRTDQNSRDIKVIKVQVDTNARRQGKINARNIRELKRLFRQLAKEERSNRQLINELRFLRTAHPELFIAVVSRPSGTATRHRKPTTKKKKAAPTASATVTTPVIPANPNAPANVLDPVFGTLCAQHGVCF